MSPAVGAINAPGSQKAAATYLGASCLKMNDMFPKIKSIRSPDLDNGVLPKNPDDCAVFIEVAIGIKDEEGEDTFSFTVITHKALSSYKEQIWGKALLITPSFSWKETEQYLQELLMHCSGKDWDVISNKINKVLGWEFENHQQ